MNAQNTIQPKSLPIQSQYPETLPSKVGSTDVLLYKKVLIRDQIPDPLPPALGSTKILLERSFSERYSATIQPHIITTNPFPEPSPSKIGEEDLPGGFKKKNLVSGKNTPLYDLSRGIVQIDGVAVFFDAKA